MINIDKVIFAFKTRIQYHNKEVFQFDKLKEKISKIDSINEKLHSDDFAEELNSLLPYKFGNTELKEVSLKQIKTHYKYNFYVYVSNILIGILQFETHGNSRNYGYLTLNNETLYNGDWRLYKQAINDLELEINHISKLDLAYDSTINPTKKYLQIIKDIENEIIINGVKINNRNVLLQTPYFISYGTLNEPLKYPQIHFATQDKSTTIKVYNKSEEVENSKKSYIKETFKSIKNEENKPIYRCEVSLNTHSINRIIEEVVKENDLDCEEEGLSILLERLESNDYLLQLHKTSMMRLIRYSHKGKKRKTLLSYYNI